MRKLTSMLLASALLVSSISGMGLTAHADTGTAVTSSTRQRILYEDFEAYTSNRALRTGMGYDISGGGTVGAASKGLLLETGDPGVGLKSMSTTFDTTGEQNWGFFRVGNALYDDGKVLSKVDEMAKADLEGTKATDDTCLTFWAKIEGTDAEGNTLTSFEIHPALVVRQIAFIGKATVTNQWAKYSVPISEMSDSAKGYLYDWMASSDNSKGALVNLFRFSVPSSAKGTIYLDEICIEGSNLVDGFTFSRSYDSSTSVSYTTKLEDIPAEPVTMPNTEIMYEDFEAYTSNRALRTGMGYDISGGGTVGTASKVLKLETGDPGCDNQSMSTTFDTTGEQKWGYFRVGNSLYDDGKVLNKVEEMAKADLEGTKATDDTCLTFWAKIEGTDAEGNTLTSFEIQPALVVRQTAFVGKVTVTNEWAKYAVPISEMSDSVKGYLYDWMVSSDNSKGALVNLFRFGVPSSAKGTIYLDNIAIAGSNLVDGHTFSRSYDSSTSVSYTTKIAPVNDNHKGGGDNTSSDITSSDDTSSGGTSSSDEPVISGGDPVDPTDSDGIIDLFENIKADGTDRTASIPKGDGFLLDVTTTKDTTITIQINRSAANLTYQIPVKAGTSKVSVDFVKMVSGTRSFYQLSNKSNLTLTISADQSDVTINKLSYYIYSYLLDREVNIEPDHLRGDTNLDGQVDAKDALETLRSVVGLVQLTDEQKAVTDIDGEPGITAKDALIILRIVVGLEK